MQPKALQESMMQCSRGMCSQGAEVRVLPTHTVVQWFGGYKLYTQCTVGGKLHVVQQGACCPGAHASCECSPWLL